MADKKKKKTSFAKTFRRIRLYIYLGIVIVLAMLFSPLFSGHPGIFMPPENPGETPVQSPIKTVTSDKPSAKFFKIVIKEDKFFVKGVEVDATAAATLALNSKLQIALEYAPSARTSAESAINAALKALNLKVDRVTKILPVKNSQVPAAE